MAGLTPSLPLRLDPNDGAYKLIKNNVDLIKQNFKNLVLTSPGERVMDPEFGVGIRNFLFENMNDSTYGQISERIKEQVDEYMPFIALVDVQFIDNETSVGRQGVGGMFDFIGPNNLGIKIIYEIIPIGIIDEISF